MAIPNYPNNPILNDTFVVGDKTFQWDGEKWKSLSNDRDKFFVGTTSELEASRPNKTGQRAENLERVNAQYVLAESGYTALAGDITAANGRVWKLVINAEMDVRQFGAVPNSTDASQAITAAINSDARVITGGNFTYKCSQQISLTSNKKLKDITLDMQELVGLQSNRVYALGAEGSLGDAYVLLADAEADSGPIYSINLGANASQFSQGDVIQLREETFWNPDNNCFVGELVEVLAVNGNNVILSCPLVYSYFTANNATARKINTVENITLENVNAVGNANPAGITTDDAAQAYAWDGTGYSTPNLFMGFIGFYCAKNVKVENCNGEIFNRAGVEFRTTYNAWLNKSEMKNIINYYGVLIGDSAKYTYIHNNTFLNTRHGVSTGGTNSGGGGIVNFLDVVGNYSSGRDAALDCHDETDNVNFSGNMLHCDGLEDNNDGVVFQGARFICNNNTITGFVNIGIRVQTTYTYQGVRPSTQICGNKIYTSKVDDAGTPQGVSIECGFQGGPTASATIIRDNLIEGLFDRGVYVLNRSESVEPVRVLDVSGNTILESKAQGVYIQATGDGIQDLKIQGNTVKPSGANAYDCIVLRPDTGASITNASISGNMLSNGANGVRYLGVGSFDNIRYTDNNIYNCNNEYPANTYTYTISAGVINLTGESPYILEIDTEAAAATDDLDTINNGYIGQQITLSAVNDARTVVVKDGANLRINGDFPIDSVRDTITLKYNGAVWLEVCRSNNA